jgi:hypothetical protein
MTREGSVRVCFAKIRFGEGTATQRLCTREFFTAVRNFLRCGDLASGFLRFHCSDCGHERLLAFTCKGRHLCPPAQRRVRQTADWIAEYLLRHPFSLQKITWNPTTQTVIYRSKRNYTTKRNFEIFKAPDFIAAILRFRAGSFEWQAIGELIEAKNALRSFGEEGQRRRVAHAGNFSHI